MGSTIYAARQDGNARFSTLQVQLTENALITRAVVVDSNGKFYYSNSGSGGSGTVTSVSVVSANGLAGTVATSTTTPAITISTTITGILKGNGTAISAATPGTDYITTTAGTALSASFASTASFFSGTVVSASFASTASFFSGTVVSASFASTASFAPLYVLNSQTSSFVTNAQTSSFVQNSQTSSFVTNSQTSSFVQNSQTSSFVTNSQTSSFVQNSQTSSMTVLSASFALTASSADNFTVRGTLTAQTIVAQTITSSTEFITGSTRFGSLVTDTHQFTGSVSITGSLNVVGTGITGSLLGTASWANNATTASYILQAVSASFATLAQTANTASYVVTAQTASFALSASTFNISTALIIDQTLTDYASVASSTIGSNNLFTQATGSYTSAFFKYTAYSASAATRAGEVVSAWNGTTETFTDFSTVDFGNTSGVTTAVTIVGANVQFNVTTTTAGWSIKSLATFM